MKYFFLDTHVLSDLIKQYDPFSPNKRIEHSPFIKQTMLSFINQSIESDGEQAMIVASTFSFVELLNKFSDIFQNSNITYERINDFLKKTPNWFIIDDLNLEVAKVMPDVPQRDSFGAPISGDDAILIATALTRTGDEVFFLTSDHKLETLKIEGIRIIT